MTSDDLTTCWPCPACQAVLTTRTAVAHVCGAGMPCAANSDPDRTDTGAQGQSGHAGDPPTPAGGTILRADHVAMIQGMADYWSGQPLPPQMQAFLADDVPALVASHAALTARLAAVEGVLATAHADVERLRARTHELQHTYSQELAPLQKRLAWFEGLWERSLRWIELHQPDFEREEIAAWIARAPADVKDRIVRHPCSPAERARIGALLAMLEQAEAERDTLQVDLDRTRQHCRTRHGIGCAFTEESVPLPEDFGEEPTDGR